MNCPNCDQPFSTIVKTRHDDETPQPLTVERDRVCPGCGTGWQTIETVKDGWRQPPLFREDIEREVAHHSQRIQELWAKK
jgi:transcriptional regulator NrdR family protein